MRGLPYTVRLLLLSVAPVVACTSTTKNNLKGDDTGAAGETSTSNSSDGGLSVGGAGGSGDGSTASQGGTGGSSGGTGGTGGASSGDNSAGGAGGTGGGGAGGSGGGSTDSTTSAGSGGGTTDSATSEGSGGSTTSAGSGGATSGGSGGGTTDSTSTTSGGSGGGTSTDSTAATSTTGSSCTGSTCTSECPCSTGEGACSNDDECAAGLVCTTAAVAKLGFTGGTKSCMPAHCDNDAVDDDLGETSQDCGGDCGCRATYDEVDFEGVPGAIEHIYFEDMSGDGSTIVGHALDVEGDPGRFPITVSPSGLVTFLESFGVDGSADFVSNDGSIIAGGLSCDDPPDCTTDADTAPVRWVGDADPVSFPFDVDSIVHGMSASGNVVAYTLTITDPDRASRFVVSTASSTYTPELVHPDGVSGNGAVIYGPGLPNGEPAVWYTATDEVWFPPLPSEWSGRAAITAMSTDGSVFVGEGLIWPDIMTMDYFPFISQDQSFELVDIVDDRLIDVRPRDLSADGTRFVGIAYNEDTGSEEGVFWDEAGGARTLYDELVARGLEFPIDVTAIGAASFISSNGRIIVGEGSSGLPFRRVVLSD